MPRLVITIRAWLTWLCVVGLILICMFYFSLPDFFTATPLFLFPLFFLVVQLVRVRPTYGIATSIILAIPALPLLWDLDQTRGFGLMLALAHMDFPPIIISTVFFWAITAPLFLLETGHYAENRLLSRSVQKRGFQLASFSVATALVSWWFLITLLHFQAEKQAMGRIWCLQDGTGFRTTKSVDLAPHALLFGNRHEKIKRPYLLLHIDGKGWDHHWSFLSLNFVEHEDPWLFQQARNLNRDPDTDFRCGSG